MLGPIVSTSAAFGVINLGRQDQLRVQIDDVFGLVGQMRAAVLHLGDPAVGVGFAPPLFVRDLLVLAIAIEPSHFFGRRFVALLDLARFLHQTPDILLPVLARVAADDALHRRVGFQRRGVDAHRLAFQAGPVSSATRSTNWNTAA